jgi:hypothetical protein
MKNLIDALMARLRDPAEAVAKTSKKLILELQKCYPQTFKSTYIDSLSNDDERAICELILENKFTEAQQLVMSTSPSKRMAVQQKDLQSNNFGGQGKALVPTPTSPLLAQGSPTNSILSPTAASVVSPSVQAASYAREKNLSTKVVAQQNSFGSSADTAQRQNSV